MIDIRFQSTASVPTQGRLTRYGCRNATHIGGLFMSCLGIDPMLVGMSSHEVCPGCGCVIPMGVSNIWTKTVERDGVIIPRWVPPPLDVAV